jgi:putative ABC transport system ATP-binding protein
MVEPLIRLQNVKKHFSLGKTMVRALDGVDLEIFPHTFTVIMGPSGSGKSTLLYLLGGLDRPTAGEIVFGGHRLNDMDENQLARFRRHAVGFVFQAFNLIQNMTAEENVSFPMQFAGVPARQRKQRALDLLAQVGLRERGHHRPTELSGGEQQRVAIARALVNDPQVILADEPTGNLDSASGMSVMRLLATLQQAGRTVIVVTHDPRMARFATHRIYLLDGRVVSEERYRAISLETGEG